MRWTGQQGWKRSGSRAWLGPAGVSALLLIGLWLRLYFLRHHAFLAGDSFLYQEIAQNWLHEHVYGLSTDTATRPTLIRLPGYPAVLAVCDVLFGRWLNAEPGTLRSFLPVLWLQVAADLITCILVASMVRRMAGVWAALWTLALGCLCPFTANYTAVPLTEIFVLICLTLSYYALQRWLESPKLCWLVLLAAALSYSVLLRPDQGLLALATMPLLTFQPGRSSLSRLRAPALCLLLAALPFVPWTVRNYRTFHVFQPLASRLAIDPGETAPTGFQAWYRTWAVDFASTQDAYWNYPEDPVLTTNLPSRAFDSPAERNEVAALLQRTAATSHLNPVVEQRFRELAAQRAAARPLRVRVLLPLARLADMLLRPRTEMLPIADRWWHPQAHPKQTTFALFYAALNLIYLLLGALGFFCWFRIQTVGWRTRSLLLSMLAYILLRCLLLLTLDNAEQRYTLEFFPLLFIFAGGLWARREQAHD